MLRQRNVALAAKLSVLLVLLAVVPLTAVTQYNESSARAELLAATQAQNLWGARNTARLLDIYLAETIRDISYVASDTDTVEFLENPANEEARGAVRRDLLLFRDTRQVDAVYLTSQKGDVLVASDPRLVGRSYAGSPFFAGAMEGRTSIDEPRYDSEDGQVYLHFSAPVRGSEGRPSGAAIGRTTMSPIDRIVGSDSNFAGRRGFGVLWDGDGIRLSHPNRIDWRFRPFAPLPSGVVNALVSEGRYGPTTADLLADTNLARGLVDRALLLLRDRDADPHLRFSSPRLGSQDVSIVPLSQKQWLYGIFTAEAEMLSAVNSQTQRALLAAAAAGLVAALAALALARWVAGPIDAIARTARSLASGDMSPRTGLKRGDEIGELALAFDTMADALTEKEAQLRNHAEQLAQLVEQRTAELQRLNRLYYFLSQVNQSVVRARDPEKLFDEVCRVAVQNGLFRMAWVGLVDDQTEEVVPVARFGADEGFLDAIRVSARDIPEGRGVAGTAIRTGEHCIADDVEHDDRLVPWREEALRRGYRSVGAFPLRVGNGVVGVFVAHADEARFFGCDEIRLLDELAMDVSFALEAMEQESRRKQAEEAVHRSEARFRAIFEGAAVGISLQDLEGKLVERNPALQRMLGYREEELRGMSFVDFSHPDDVAQQLGLHGELVAGKRDNYCLEKRYIRREGVPVWVRTTVSLIRGTEAQPEFVIAMVEDISDRKQVEEQLLRAQRLEAAGRIAAQVAHDFNNLLVPMAAYPELIKMRLPHDHPAVPFCDTMLGAARQMAEINHDMMALGRRGRIERQPADLNQVVRQAVDRIVDAPDTLVLDLDLAPDNPPVDGSQAQLLRVVANLVSNAREAMHDAGLLRIKTEYLYIDQPHDRADIGEYIRLTVTDTGCGIPPEIRDRVFDAFFTTKLQSRKPGAGLGLSIVQAVVEDHRGYLELESDVGKGTSFSIYLPVRRQALGESPSDSLPRGVETVLVVDDDPLQREAATRLLQSLGYQVEVAANGEEAVAYLREHSVDLLMLDMIMPGGMDGTESYRRVLDVRPGQRAIIVSGFAESGRVRQAQALGAGAYLRKPVTLQRLAQAVREELDRVH